MGRLFWKFFFASWLAMLSAGTGVGTVIWWRHQALEQAGLGREHALIDRRAAPFVAAATEVLQYGGKQALLRFLQQSRGKPGPPVIAVDDTGRDILNRSLEPKVLNQARLACPARR